MRLRTVWGGTRPGGHDAGKCVCASSVLGDGFDTDLHRYRDLVDRSIAFIGQDHDFFLELKARHLVAATRRHLGDPSGLRALDVGCGVGFMDVWLQETFASLSGVDVADRALQDARRRNPGVVYAPYDGVRLPYAAESFDLAFAVNVLHHVPGPARREFLREMGRVVRPGGLGFIFEHNPLNPLTVRAVRQCPFDKDVTLSRCGQSRQLLVEAGWRVIEARFIVFFPWRSALWRALEALLGWLPLGAQYCVAASRG